MNKSTAIIGGVLIFFGLFFLLRSMNVIWFDFGELLQILFPLLLIGGGIWLISRHKKKSFFKDAVHFSEPPSSSGSQKARPESGDPNNLASEQAKSGSSTTPPPGREDSARQAPSGHSGNKLRFNKGLGDMFIDCEGYNLGNVEVSAGVGDLEIKISGGVLNKGLNRMIVSGFIGDIRFFVPKDFDYFAHCSNFVGEIEIAGKKASGFSNVIEHQSLNYDKAESKLYIAASNFIGDMKIYQV